MIHEKASFSSNAKRRGGTTLSEVLISLLVMSVGVVSLATLFPISVLRTAQATQLTNATNLRYNVEALVDTLPSLYSVGPTWTSGTAYSQGALVTPTELTALKAPPVVFICTTAGTSGAFEPAWNYDNGATTTDPLTTPATASACVWTTIALGNYVVDPLGEVLVESAYRNIAGNGDFFGNDPTLAPVPQTRARAFSGFASTPSIPLADSVATLPDSWINRAESVQVSYNSASPPSITMTDLTDLLPAVSGGLPVTRILLFDITGKISCVRQVTSTSNAGVNSQTVTFNNVLPTGFTPVKVRVESKDRKYTWLLSIRRGFSGVSYMDVVVFFKRPFSGKDEQLYPATFTSTTDFGSDAAPGIAGIDDDNNGIVDFLGSGAPDPGEIGWPGSDDVPRNWVVVQYDATGDKPFVKKGGFVTDIDNLRWYQIIDVVEGDGFYGFSPTNVMTKAGLVMTGLNPLPYANTYTADAPYYANTKAIFLRIEGQIEQTGSQPAGGLGGPPQGRAMLMRGIVDVYPIRTHLTWSF